MDSVGTAWMWVGFFTFVLAMLAADLFAFGGRRAHKVSIREAAAWSSVWVALALAFNAALWLYLGGLRGDPSADERALEFLTGYER